MFLKEIEKPVIGMVHLLSLPGSHRFEDNLHAVEEKAVADAMALKNGGVDAIIVENACDGPNLIGDEVDFATIATMSVYAKMVKDLTGLPVGISCSTNAVRADLAIAKASGADFVRSTGWVNGYFSVTGFVEPASAKALRYRELIRARDVQVMADVQVKNGSHLFVSDKSLAEQCSDAKNAGAEYVILTGHTSGVAPDLETIKELKQKVALPLLIGSGATTENVAQYLSYSDGVIIGSYFKKSGKMAEPIIEEKVKLFMQAVNTYRKTR